MEGTGQRVEMGQRVNAAESLSAKASADTATAEGTERASVCARSRDEPLRGEDNDLVLEKKRRDERAKAFNIYVRSVSAAALT